MSKRTCRTSTLWCPGSSLQSLKWRILLLVCTYLFCLWAERVTICKCMGCSPYFGAHRTHLLLPVDIVEANYPLPPPAASLTTMELIAWRAITLQKWPDQLVHIHDKSIFHMDTGCSPVQTRTFTYDLGLQFQTWRFGFSPEYSNWKST